MEKPIKVIHTIHHTANVTEKQAKEIYLSYMAGGFFDYARFLALIGTESRDIEFTDRVNGGCWKLEG